MLFGGPESAIRFLEGVQNLASELLTDLKYSLTLVPEGQQGNQKKENYQRFMAEMMIRSNYVSNSGPPKDLMADSGHPPKI